MPFCLWCAQIPRFQLDTDLYDRISYDEIRREQKRREDLRYRERLEAIRKDLKE